MHKHHEAGPSVDVDVGVVSVSSLPSASVAATDSVVLPASEPEPAAPRYDLAADIEDQKKALSKELGKWTKFEVVEHVFLLATPGTTPGPAAGVAKQAIAAYFNGRFKTRPERAVAVILFETAAAYQGYCKAHGTSPCTSPYGFYDPNIRSIVMHGVGLGTLTHELVHPIVEADFPSAPDWINEGLASLYEAYSMPKPGEIYGHKNWRHPRLLTGLRSKAERIHASLPALFAMSDTEFRGDREKLNYASARYFCQWMDGQKKLWPFYQTWRDGFAKDPTGEKAFLAVMGKSPAQLDATWVAWVMAL